MKKTILSSVSVLNYHGASLCIAATCSGRVELEATDGSSNYTANWRGRDDRVEFLLTGRGQGWVGIGFSHNRIMVKYFFIFYHFFMSLLCLANF